MKVGEPAGTWTPAVAATNFDQQFTAHPNINAVVTPNDDNANAVIAELQTPADPGRRRSRRPVRTRRSSGLQNILKGYQCGTVYKPITAEAQAAAADRALPAGRREAAGVAGERHDEGHRGEHATSRRCCSTPKWVTDRQHARHRRSRTSAVKVVGRCASRAVAAGLHGGRHQVATASATEAEDAGAAAAALAGVGKSFGAGARARRHRPRHPAGQVTALAGDNGAGKSVLIKCIAGIHTPDHGEILWEGKPRAHPHAARRGRARDRDRPPGPRAVRQPRHRPEHVPRPRDGRGTSRSPRTTMEKAAGETLSGLAVTTVRSVRQLGRVAVGWAAAVGRDRQGRAVELEARDHGRADGRARRRADGAWCSTSCAGSPTAASPCCIVSHNMNDVFEVADRIAVLRLGRMVACAGRDEMDTQIVVDLMTTGASDRARSTDVTDTDESPTRRPDAPPTTVARRRDRSRTRDAAERRRLARATTCGVVYVRIRSGDSGVLPVVGGLLLISILFQSLNSQLPDRRQPRQPAHPGRGVHAAGDGRGLRAAARRDRPVDRVRQPASAAIIAAELREAAVRTGRGGPRSSSRCSCARRSARCRERSSRASGCRRSSSRSPACSAGRA